MNSLIRPARPVTMKTTVEAVEFPRSGSAPAPSADERRVEILRAIARSGGTLLPTRVPHAKVGHSFGALGDEAAEDLCFLAKRDYLTETFFDRVSLCPKCTGHEINLREVCPSCGSSHLKDEPLLHHFRCGFVAPVTAFAGDGDKPICPKCNGRLAHLGRDHDQLGCAYTCVACATSFQDPPVGAVCLSCGTASKADDLLHADVHSYKLTSLGAAAANRGTLYEENGEFLYVGELPVYRPTVFLELIEQEARRIKRFKGVFSVMVLQWGGGSTGLTDAGPIADSLRALRGQLRDIDLLGQIDEGSYGILLPGTEKRGARIVERRAAAIAPQAAACRSDVVVVKSPDDLRQLEAVLFERSP
jgi:hypothetical protein